MRDSSAFIEPPDEISENLPVSARLAIFPASERVWRRMGVASWGEPHVFVRISNVPEKMEAQSSHIAINKNRNWCTRSC